MEAEHQDPIEDGIGPLTIRQEAFGLCSERPEEVEDVAMVSQLRPIGWSKRPGTQDMKARGSAIISGIALPAPGKKVRRCA